VIFDTDIGDDIDDSWALVMLLKSPQLDVKLVTTTYGKAEYRAKIIARLLTVARRTDIPIGLGAGGRDGTGRQQAWVIDFKLSDYPGKVHEDGVGALIELIEKSPQPITLISVGPCNTVAAALQRRPGIAGKAYFVGMHGSVRKGYGGKKTPDAEWNVKANVAAARSVLSAPWQKIAITPLDTCGLVRLTGERFQSLLKSEDSLVKALLENYRIWAKKDRLGQLASSSVLFDTCAVYLAYPGDRPLMERETLPIVVTDQGLTCVDPAGRKMSVAVNWTSLDAYHDLLVKVLTQGTGG
jgi:inosine-uridine nucleoside N-ribohydrolase